MSNPTWVPSGMPLPPSPLSAAAAGAHPRADTLSPNVWLPGASARSVVPPDRSAPWVVAVLSDASAFFAGVAFEQSQPGDALARSLRILTNSSVGFQSRTARLDTESRSEREESSAGSCVLPNPIAGSHVTIRMHTDRARSTHSLQLEAAGRLSTD